MAARFRTLDWYDTPLYYDIIFDQHTRAEVRFVDTLYQRYLGDRGHRRVLEPGCGSGRLVTPLSRRGYHVTGFDLSEPMLDFARRRLARSRGAVDAELRVGRMESFSVRQRFDLAHCFVSTFKYLLTEAHAAAHLACVARALRVGGVYLLGFHLTDYSQESIDRERWTGRRRGVEVVCNIQSWPPRRRVRLERIRSRLRVTRQGAPLGQYETHWQFRTYSPAEFLRLVARVPELELVAVHDFDYDADIDRELGEDRLDAVAVLRRRRRR